MSFFSTKKDKVFLILAGFFITNAILGEMIGGKLIQIGPFLMSLGILPWPIVFLTTDLINEYYGKPGVKRLTLLTAGLIGYLFIMLTAGRFIPASANSPIGDDVFSAVFGQTSWLIIASLVAFLLSQLIDVTVFWLLRKKTGRGMIWLRSTGSTLLSQWVDTFTVAGIGFYLPGKLDFETFMITAGTGYLFKVMVAVGLTPLIYLGHSAIDKYLGQEADVLMDEAARESI
ncbi:MAG TPA: queuosine precursor transporter [Luteibaculaceae bacterium]|nr:queuosine precursor transporter [Luteibaculaceae bacterium]